MTSTLDKPLMSLFPELNTLQITFIRELMRKEYMKGFEAGKKVQHG